MDDREKAQMARLMAERDVARREALEATIAGELRGRGVTQAAARHLATSFSASTTIGDDGNLTRDGKYISEAALITLATDDAKLLGAGAWEPGMAPPPPKPKAGHAPDGRAMHELSTNELLALDAKDPSTARFRNPDPTRT